MWSLPPTSKIRESLDTLELGGLALSSSTRIFWVSSNELRVSYEMHDDHQHTVLQQAVQVVHRLPKIPSPLPNDPIDRYDESFQDVLCENALSQNPMFHQGSQESKHSRTILMRGVDQNVTEAFLSIVRYTLRKFNVKLRAGGVVGSVNCNERLYTTLTHVLKIGDSQTS